MGNPRSYVIEVLPERDDDNWRDNSRNSSRSRGPEMLSIVRIGDGQAHWIVVSMSADRKTVSIAPLNQGSNTGMKHGVSVDKLWPFYEQVAASA
jgi:hypothetical protein